VGSENLEQTKRNLLAGAERDSHIDESTDRLAAAMARLFNTPGASSSRPETMLIMPRSPGKNAAREAFAKQYLQDFSSGASTAATATTISAHPAITVESIRKAKSAITGVWLDEAAEIDLKALSDIPKSTGAEDMATKKTAAEVTQIKEAMVELATKVNDWLEEVRAGGDDMRLREDGPIETILTLKGPESLTVETDGKYTKAPHIGGEEFTLDSVYLGKRGVIIAKFKPVVGESYQWMEMPVGMAAEKLNCFGEVAIECVENGLFASIDRINRAATAAHEVEANKEKFNEYAAFGSW
jgi:hypothetical protein